jgi:hypothetical protein
MKRHDHVRDLCPRVAAAATWQADPRPGPEDADSSRTFAHVALSCPR